MNINKFELISRKDGRLALKKVCELQYHHETLKSSKDAVTIFKELTNATILIEEHLWILATNAKLRPVAFFELMISRNSD